MTFNYSNNVKEHESKFLQYVLYILRDSRSKKRAQARIEALLKIRMNDLQNCIIYTDEMIKEYIEKEEKEK